MTFEQLVDGEVLVFCKCPEFFSYFLVEIFACGFCQTVGYALKHDVATGGLDEVGRNGYGERSYIVFLTFGLDVAGELLGNSEGYFLLVAVAAVAFLFFCQRVVPVPLFADFIYHIPFRQYVALSDIGRICINRLTMIRLVQQIV